MSLRLPASLLLFSALFGLRALAAEPLTEYATKAVVRYQEQPPPAPGSIIFFGSSSIDMWRPLDAAFPDLPVVNRGMGGTQLSDAVYLGEALVFPFAPRLVVLYAGENDLPPGKTAAEVVAAFERFQAAFRASNPGTPLLFLALKPSPQRLAYLPLMREINAAIAERCAVDPDFTFVDVATPMLNAEGRPRSDIFLADQLHMNARGYAIWLRAIDPVMRRALKP